MLICSSAIWLYFCSGNGNIRVISSIVFIAVFLFAFLEDGSRLLSLMLSSL